MFPNAKLLLSHHSLCQSKKEKKRLKLRDVCHAAKNYGTRQCLHFFLQILQLLLSHYKKNLMGEKGCFNLRMSRAQLGFEPVF